MSVRLDHVSAGYGGPPVVVDVDLAVPSGSLTAIVGPSGCGKSTLVRTVAGFLRPLAGTIAIDGQEVSGPGVFLPPERRHVGIVLQEGALFPHLDVAGNIGFGLRRGALRDGEKPADRIDEMLALVGLDGRGRAAPQELSGGQQQRVALARALAPRPDVLLLDEPFSALDAGLRTELRAEVCDVLRSVGTTTILVTHDQQEALSVSDQVALMIGGRIIQTGDPDAIYSEPATIEAARFLGELIELPVLGMTGDRAETAIGPIPITGASASTGMVILRPEQLRLTVPAESSFVQGTVASVRYHGHDSLVGVMTDTGVPISARVAGRSPVAPGERVGLRVEGCGRMLAP